ncbi:molybdate ABC transporter substrate-binding protein [Pelagibacterium sediminicola]|uniref:molybdate ABC transporter substrate-binding protein n=1 Tax=Pelagibacterium sediminicola TaxID=2248761 RepID=UPI000E30F9D3|nr:molybdate ABC transporter substrate-binding protein [Pelagibacterium sediminicola]
MTSAKPLILSALVALLAVPAFAQDAQIAVAANFTAAAEELGAAFAEETGQTIGFSFGATGALYTQIIQGAPFDALLSADAATPARLADEGHSDGKSIFSYAIGKLVLFSTIEGLVTGPESLEGEFANIAIAEPAAAPYGAAAIETLDALGLTETLRSKFVIGQNISQTHQFVDTGNAELGFVAYSQVIGREDGSQWLVDETLYSPITQDAILLSTDNEAAAAFLDFLRSGTGTAIIESYGYAVAE